jgi:electron transfer flavoprotein alpha subunit
MSVLIYLHSQGGRFGRQAQELVSYGCALSKSLGCGLTGVSLEPVSADALSSLGRFGLTRLLCPAEAPCAHFDEQVFAAALAELARRESASVVLFSADLRGKALAPRTAVKLEAALATAVCGLPESLDPFVLKRKVFCGKAGGKIRLDAPVKVLSLASNSFELRESPCEVKLENCTLTTVSAAKTQLKDRQTSAGGRLSVTEASVLVSGGRGMKGPENWKPIEELAELLGGTTACSRPVADDGWRPHGEHVGQTGKTVAPDLYIACGISGAVQHVAGINSSKCIVAINKDPEAPIFEAAQYGVVGDVQAVLPRLIEAVKSHKAG